jgi:hypothetical protein
LLTFLCIGGADCSIRYKSVDLEPYNYKPF